MTSIIDELRALQKDVCRIYMHDYCCTTDCPFNKNGCMIDRDIARQKNKENSA